MRVGTLAGIGGVVLGLIIGFCAGGSGDAEPVALPDTTVPGTEGSTTTTTTVAEPSDEATTTSTTEPAAEPVDRNPLTGEELAEPVVRRIVSIKVDNVAAAQPQIGLNEAEMLFEVPVEGGITRFTALYFEAAPPVVGPVRSIREVDAALLAPFTPLLLTSGGQDFVTRQFEAVGISVIDQNAEGLFGIIDRPQPHHVVALLELIDRVAGDSGSSMGGFSFGDGFAPTGGATAISVPFSGVADVSWRFEDGQWVRSQNGETAEVLPTFDGSPEPMVTDTVVVLKVAQRSAGYTDSAGAQVLNFDVVGFGDAMVFHDGGVVEGRWLRSAQEDPWVIVDGDGREVPLPIGRVFVEIVPRFVEVTFQ